MQLFSLEVYITVRPLKIYQRKVVFQFLVVRSFLLVNVGDVLVLFFFNHIHHLPVHVSCFLFQSLETVQTFLQIPTVSYLLP